MVPVVAFCILIGKINVMQAKSLLLDKCCRVILWSCLMQPKLSVTTENICYKKNSKLRKIKIPFASFDLAITKPPTETGRQVSTRSTAVEDLGPFMNH